MPNNSTVRFFLNRKHVLTLFQRSEDDVNSIGKQIYDLLSSYKMVEKKDPQELMPQASGVKDLALYYVLDNKYDNEDLYIVIDGSIEKYCYELHFRTVDKVDKLIRIRFIKDGEKKFDGDFRQYIFFVKLEQDI